MNSSSFVSVVVMIRTGYDLLLLAKCVQLISTLNIKRFFGVGLFLHSFKKKSHMI